MHARLNQLIFYACVTFSEATHRHKRYIVSFCGHLAAARKLDAADPERQKLLDEARDPLESGRLLAEPEDRVMLPLIPAVPASAVLMSRSPLDVASP